MSSTTRAPYRQRRLSRAAVVIDRVLRVLLAAFFGGVAVPKLADLQVATHMFDQIGAGHWLQFAVGAAELVGAIGLLVPAVVGLAALGLCVDMIGATVVNLTVLHSTSAALTFTLSLVLLMLAFRHRATVAEGRKCSRR